jgi:transposase
MLDDVLEIRRVFIACGYVDLRKGIDGLAQIVGTRYKLNPFEKGTLFLFCGRRTDRCKGLLWRGNGFILLYRRFEDGSMSWPRTPEEAAEITEEQFRMLMKGLNPVRPKIRDVFPTRVY